MLKDALTLSALIAAVLLVRAAFKPRAEAAALRPLAGGAAEALPAGDRIRPAAAAGEQTAAVQQTETPAQSAPAAQQPTQAAAQPQTPAQQPASQPQEAAKPAAAMRS
ncbi:MAG: hypothetical protein ACLT1T_03275 [Oscillospiraceae bacterium]